MDRSGNNCHAKSTWKNGKVTWCTCRRCGENMPLADLQKHCEEKHFTARPTAPTVGICLPPAVANMVAMMSVTTAPAKPNGNGNGVSNWRERQRKSFVRPTPQRGARR